MNEETRQAHEVLRAVVRSFTSYPDEIDLCVVEVSGGAYWRMTVHADDQNKVIGREGSHIKALSFLMAQMGKRHAMVYKLKLKEPLHGVRRYQAPVIVRRQYNPSPAHELLSRIVSIATCGRVHVEIDEDEEPLSYIFTLVPRTAADHHALTDCEESHRQTVLGSLGTLWRAYAQRDGVKFVLQIAPPVRP